jgi:pseudouridine synthase
VRVEVPRRYYLLNKPRGYVCTRTDPQGRPTIIDLLREKGIHGYLYPVGRLDSDSEGLILVTNDGDLAARLAHPRHGVEREYEARVRGGPNERALERLRRGVLLEGRRTAPADVRLVSALKERDQAVLAITLREGRNRQVRHMCELVGHAVVRLRRVRIGPLQDPRLAPGHARPLTAREVAALKQVPLTPKAPPSRISPAPTRRSGSGASPHRRA